MKILHTSDWHLGHSLYNYDRTIEQQSMLEQMVKIVSDHKPDVFLLCGDVYHTSQPSASVQTMFTKGLAAIRMANPDMLIVTTAGNHDSGSKHEIFRTPWQALGVHAIGNVNKEEVEAHLNKEEETEGYHIIEIPDKGFIVAIPYCHERNMPEDFFQSLLDIVKERNVRNLPVIMTAHTTVKGCNFEGHDNANERVVGGIDALDIAQMGDGYDYLALGHIHHAQFVHTGKHNVRYCGSPIAVSFDESYTHSVSMVEIARHGDTPKVDTLEIKNPHPLVTLPTSGFASWEEVTTLLSKYPKDIPAYIRLNVELEDTTLPVDAFAEARNLTEDKKCKFCHINTKRKNAKQTEVQTMTYAELQTKEPIEIAKRYFEDKEGIAFDDELIALFNETLELIREEERNAE